mgnify:CR=1 FL=1
MSTRTPQTIAAHITTALIPAITTTAGQHGRHPGNLITRLQGAAINLANVDLPAIAASLGREHHTAAAGRPRQGAGGNTGGIGTSTTEDISCELDRISRYWLDLTETIDRLHPHPDWPPITSGLRARLTTATEALIAVCVAPGATQDPQVAWEDLTDAVEGVQVATAAVMHAARRASRARAWAREHDLDDIDPPDTLTEAARCTGWPNGKDKAGEPIGCRNWRTDHRDPNGATHHEDLCLDCYALLCPQCWQRPRRTPGARECMACEIRNRRTRHES